MAEKVMRISRRDFVKSAGAGAAGLALAGGLGGFSKAGEKPNVLLVVVDQWREPRWFPEKLDLPGFNRLCQEGLQFTNFFTSAVPCSPSRACLFTGLHLSQHGVESNVNAGLNPSLDPRIPTLGHLFQQAGYRTPYFGKWHLTLAKEYRQNGLNPYGFEEWRGPDHDGLPREGEQYDGRFANQALAWLGRHGKEKPWFLTCSLINPHDIVYYRRIVPRSGRVPAVVNRLPENFNDDLHDKPRIQTIYRDTYGKLMGTTPDQPEQVWLRYLDYYLN